MILEKRSMDPGVSENNLHVFAEQMSIKKKKSGERESLLSINK